MPETSASLQQVGLARVHVEIISLSDHKQGWKGGKTKEIGAYDSKAISKGPGDDGDGGYSSDVQDTDGSSVDISTTSSTISDPKQEPSTADPKQGPSTADPKQGPSTVSNPTKGQEDASAAGQPALPPKRRRIDETEDEGNDRPRKGRPRRPQTKEFARRRFACPYQAYEPWRDCFKPSQRNPSGGCDNISRLKEHMTRKHMSSYRCQQCWRHFNSRPGAQEHPQGGCIPRPMPISECFMTLEQETGVENCTGTGAEDTWWNLFLLLIPGMATEELSQLQQHYYPYYVHVGMALTIPPLNLSSNQFGHASTQLLGQASENETTPAFPASSSNNAFLGLGSSNLTSQSFSVPIYGAPIPGVVDLSAAQGPDSAINVLSAPASSIIPAPSSTLNTSQLQRNQERLRSRVEHTDAENGELRATINTNREEVRTAGEILEGVLNTANLEGEAFDQLSHAAEILLNVIRRLR